MTLGHLSLWISLPDRSCELDNVQCDWKDRLVSIFLFKIPECVFVICKGKTNHNNCAKKLPGTSFQLTSCLFLISSMLKPAGIKYFWTGYNLKLENRLNLPTSSSLWNIGEIRLQRFRASKNACDGAYYMLIRISCICQLPPCALKTHTLNPLQLGTHLSASFGGRG